MKYSKAFLKAIEYHIGICIKRARIHKSVKSKDLAKAIGVTAQTITAWERGQCSPSAAMLSVICMELDMPAYKSFDYDFLSSLTRFTSSGNGICA